MIKYFKKTKVVKPPVQTIFKSTKIKKGEVYGKVYEKK